MRIQKIDNSAPFKAVNEKYIERAKKQIILTGKVHINLFQAISHDVFKHQKLHYKDAIDTIKAIKGFALDIGEPGEALLTTLIKNKPQFKIKK